MGPLRVVYNVTSNIRPYADDSSSSTDSHSAPSTIDDSAINLYSRDGVTPTTPTTPHADFDSPFWRYVPGPLERAAKKVGAWAKGPNPPRPWAINPFFPKVQTAPLRILHRFFPKQRHRVALLAAFYFCWLLCFSTVLHYSGTAGDIPGYGTPTSIECYDTYWFYKNECGVNGDLCRPFADNKFAFRCPGACLSVEVLNPHAVGTQEVNYQPLVIGGAKNGSTRVQDAVYRGDSFICSAAIHSGFLPNAQGGCGVVSLVGTSVGYPSVRQNGINSVGFDSSFPLSFKFLENTRSDCKDLRWSLLAVSIIFSALLSLFTTSTPLFFASTFVGLFLHVALVSDPPENADLYTLTSDMISGFLPAAFVAYVVYRFCITKTLDGLQAQIEKTVLWLGACWVGALDNYTLEKIPLQRLTPHDLGQQPGAITALVIIILVLIVLAVGQAWAFRVAGLMPRYLAVYGVLAFVLVMLLAVPNMNLRIHHYILALLLIPGTSLQTRPSLVYQGLLVGLFINGIARWGFDGILQTAAELQGDAQLGTALPRIRDPVATTHNITFDWGRIPTDFDGISVLVNDVERLRRFGRRASTEFTWSQVVEDHPQYFRFGYMSGSTAADYTKAGVWNADGSWTKMKSGPS